MNRSNIEVKKLIQRDFYHIVNKIKYCISSKYPVSKIQILIILQESEMVHFINKTVTNESKLAFKL
jgi:hypothetical protein